MTSGSHRWSRLVKVLLVVALALANIYVAAGTPEGASAHMDGTHFHKGGANVTFGVSNFGIYRDDAQRALTDQFTNIGILYWAYTDAHTDISVYDDNFLTSEGCGAHVSYDNQPFDGHRNHSHSYYNRDCGWDANGRQGIFCQEIAHAWSQNHHNEQNSCMWVGYGGSGIYITPHDNSDFYNFYRYH